jgi:hypothetical protein
LNNDQPRDRGLRGTSLYETRGGPDQALELWSHLRQQSNVELGSVELVGGGRGLRRVALDVTVDGVKGAALSVMSQGELTSLALSLFLPRAMLDDSPFRFIVIDDPVQSMDPARIDGLAPVLERTARTRQVVVFTHDERLHEATLRLQIEASVISVTRRPHSVVELSKTLDRVSTYLDDAQAVANTDTLAPEVMRRVVPGLCRHALEAACTEIVRGRLLRKGQPHIEVETQFEDAGKLMPLAALALLDSSQRGGEVTAAIRTHFRSARRRHLPGRELGCPRRLPR